MSIAGILSSALFSASTQSVHSKAKDFRQEFQQLGQDLQSGNLSTAQTDLTALEKLGPQADSTSASQSTSPIAQAFNQLSKDLKAGNTSAAQQDYATIQQDLQSQTAQAGGHHHHHGAGDGGREVSQLLDQLGQELQSGDLSGAQQAYSALQQTFQQLQSNGFPGQSATQSGASGVSVSA